MQSLEVERQHEINSVISLMQECLESFWMDRLRQFLLLIWSANVLIENKEVNLGTLAFSSPMCIM